MAAKDHPRSRGEYVRQVSSLCQPEGSSPLSRGIHPAGTFRALGERIIPALAGNTGLLLIQQPGQEDHPRSRGEYQSFDADDGFVRGSSPLSRGIRGGWLRRSRRMRIIPALAGNTTGRAGVRVWRRDHPRSRGEYQLRRAAMHNAHGSSPLSRGIRTSSLLRSGASRIIPALAGNTWLGSGSAPRPADHPRSRGEYAMEDSTALVGAGSSPLSRGIQSPLLWLSLVLRIIPALAGNTRRRRYPHEWCRDHPRSRGEYTRAAAVARRAAGSSPLSRGIPPDAPTVMACYRIIPALAGNTHECMGYRLLSRDHPRSRGEYRDVGIICGGYLGSSPLSRGILNQMWRLLRLLRIIPALAGNTRQIRARVGRV